MRQLGGEDRGLQTVEPAVDALDLVLMLHEPAMARQHRHLLGQLTVIGDDGAGIAHRPEVLAGIRTNRWRQCRTCRSAGRHSAPDAPGRNLHHPELVLPRDRHDRVHVGRLPIKMHGNDADRTRRDPRLNRRGIDGEGQPIGIRKIPGVAPAWVIIAAVEIHECAVVITFVAGPHLQRGPSPDRARRCRWRKKHSA